MYVLIDLSGFTSQVTLQEPDDFSRFHVALSPASEVSRLDEVLHEHGLGFAHDSAQAYIRVEALASSADVADDDGWRARLDQMTDFAKSRGWWDDAHRALAAHVETQG